MEQGSKEWHKDRLGKITASNAHKIMGPRGLGKTGETYIYELVSGEMGVYMEDVTSAAMRWGSDLEADAREYYSIAFKVEVEQKGFIHNGKNFECGFSPDGIVNDQIGQEIKCPYNPGNHVKHLTINSAADLKELSKEYYWQIMFSMWCCGFKKWHFVSYDPRFTGSKRMHVVPIEADEKEFEIIEARVKEALELKHDILSRINHENNN